MRDKVFDITFSPYRTRCFLVYETGPGGVHGAYNIIHVSKERKDLEDPALLLEHLEQLYLGLQGAFHYDSRGLSVYELTPSSVEKLPTEHGM